MNKQIFKISMIAFAIILLLQVASFAAVGKLTVKVLTDKNTYVIGDQVNVTVDWTQGMQAASFKLKYDANQLTFQSCSLGDSYYNATTKGVVSVNWASLDDKDATQIKFVFTAKKVGETKLEVSDCTFATGNVEEPSSYENGSKTITISPKLENIAITKAPTKTAYQVGEKFDKTGMEITANYSDGSKKVVTNYTVTPSTALKTSNTSITISYTENGITKTATQKITVAQVPGSNDNTNQGDNNTNNQEETGKLPTAGDNKTDKKDETTATGKMPQTGSEQTTIAIIAVLSVVAIAGFIGYRRLSDI